MPRIGVASLQPDFISCLFMVTRHPLYQGNAFGSPESSKGEGLRLNLAVLRKIRGIQTYINIDLRIPQLFFRRLLYLQAA